MLEQISNLLYQNSPVSSEPNNPHPYPECNTQNKSIDLWNVRLSQQLFTKLSLVVTQGQKYLHSVRFKLTNNELLTRMVKYYTIWGVRDYVCSSINSF